MIESVFVNDSKFTSYVWFTYDTVPFKKRLGCSRIVKRVFGTAV
jgi:hypothetical protein